MFEHLEQRQGRNVHLLRGVDCWSVAGRRPALSQTRDGVTEAENSIHLLMLTIVTSLLFLCITKRPSMLPQIHSSDEETSTMTKFSIHRKSFETANDGRVLWKDKSRLKTQVFLPSLSQELEIQNNAAVIRRYKMTYY